MSTPEELEYLCKCLSVDAEELAASAAALIENLGALPPKCQARLYWRSLVKEATFNLTDVDETVVALLNRLDNVAAAAGVDAPDNALLVGARIEMCVRHLRHNQDVAAFATALEKFFPSDTDYSAPGRRLERAKCVHEAVRAQLLSAADGDEAVIQELVRTFRVDDVLDNLADYLDAVDSKLGVPAVKAATTPMPRNDAPPHVDEEEDEEEDWAVPGGPATQAFPTSRHPGSPRAPPAASPRQKAAAAAAAKSPARVVPAASPKRPARPTPVPAAAPDASPPQDESALAQMTWPRVSLAALRRACPNEDFDALRERGITAADAAVEAAARARQRANLAPPPGRGRSVKRAPLADKDDEDDDEDDKRRPQPSPTASKGRAAHKKTSRPQKRAKVEPAAVEEIVIEEDVAAPIVNNDMDEDEEDPKQQQQPMTQAAVAVVSPFTKVVRTLGAVFGYGGGGAVEELRDARAVLKKTGTDPLVESLAEAGKARPVSGGAAAAPSPVARKTPPSGGRLLIDPLIKGPTARTVPWSGGNGAGPSKPPRGRHDDDDDDIEDEDDDIFNLNKTADKELQRKEKAARKKSLVVAQFAGKVPAHISVGRELDGGRRVAVPWTEEEEEQLKELYKQIRHTTRVWRDILKSGTFQAGRTSVDIKDKWRNLQKKGEISYLAPRK